MTYKEFRDKVMDLWTTDEHLKYGSVGSCASRVLSEEKAKGNDVSDYYNALRQEFGDRFHYAGD